MAKTTLNITRDRARRIILNKIIYRMRDISDYDLAEIADVVFKNSTNNFRITVDCIDNDDDKV